jgi:hypothetical protein
MLTAIKVKFAIQEDVSQTSDVPACPVRVAAALSDGVNGEPPPNYTRSVALQNSVGSSTGSAADVKRGSCRAVEAHVCLCSGVYTGLHWPGVTAASARPQLQARTVRYRQERNSLKVARTPRDCSNRNDLCMGKRCAHNRDAGCVAGLTTDSALHIPGCSESGHRTECLSVRDEPWPTLH